MLFTKYEKCKCVFPYSPTDIPSYPIVLSFSICDLFYSYKSSIHLFSFHNKLMHIKTNCKHVCVCMCLRPFVDPKGSLYINLPATKADGLRFTTRLFQINKNGMSCQHLSLLRMLKIKKKKNAEFLRSPKGWTSPRVRKSVRSLMA